MHQSLRRLSPLILSLVLFFPILASGMARIELNSGGVINAEIISEKPDRVFVDLGFTVLVVPRERIASIEIVDSETVSSIHGDDLYRIMESQPQAMNSQELVNACGQSVVLIRTPTGLGSGFIIHPDGYVVTNDHVIAGEHKITVTLFDQGENELLKTTYNNIRIVASNPVWDLALLKIEAEEGSREIDLPTVPLGNSDNVNQGETVVAIGNPLGLERSVSQGIVSIRNRMINGSLFIQTTAQINPGNSGGPLFNQSGEVIGVNNMKIVAMGAEGLGFSIPVNVLKSFLKNRDAFAFDARNPNAGFQYYTPPKQNYDTEKSE